MTPELEKKLFENYKKCFGVLDNPQDNLMCFGFECGDGWYNLLDSAFRKIYKIIPLGIEIKVEQIKEKFGTLRFYYTPRSDDKDLCEIINDIVSNTENESSIICEVCGFPGIVRSKGRWLACRCKECATKEEYPLTPYEKGK